MYHAANLVRSRTPNVSPRIWDHDDAINDGAIDVEGISGAAKALNTIVGHAEHDSLSICNRPVLNVDRACKPIARNVEAVARFVVGKRGARH
jgi:hypothetical protein